VADRGDDGRRPRRFGPAVVDVGGDIGRQPLIRRSRRAQGPAERGTEILDDELHDSRSELVLVGEVPVDGATAESGLFRDGDERGAAHSAGGEELGGRFDQSSPGELLALATRQSGRGGVGHEIRIHHSIRIHISIRDWVPVRVPARDEWSGGLDNPTTLYCGNWPPRWPGTHAVLRRSQGCLTAACSDCHGLWRSDLPITSTILDVALDRPDQLALVGAEDRLSYGELVEDSRVSFAVVDSLHRAQPEPPMPAVETRGVPITAVSTASAFFTARLIAGLAGFRAVSATIDPRWPLDHQIGVIRTTGIGLVISDSSALAEALADTGWTGTVISPAAFAAREDRVRRQ